VYHQTLHRKLAKFTILQQYKNSKTEFLLIGLWRQLSKIHNYSISIDITQSAHNLGLMNISRPPIRSLHCLNPAIITSVLSAVSALDLHTAKTIATSILHSKLDYYNSLYYSLPKYQILVNHLQHTQTALTRTVVQAPKFQHITPILKSFH